MNKPMKRLPLAFSIVFALIVVGVVTHVRGQQQESAAGRAQAIALRFGKGKVVVLGEAAMITAQVVGSNKLKFGMNRDGNDNKQLALNIMHWLSGLLDR
jgi:hypothetical protein